MSAIKIERNANVVSVNVDQIDILKPESVKLVLDQIKTSDAKFFNDLKWFVYNCSNVNTVAAMCFPILCRLASHLEQYNIHFCLVGSNKITDVIYKQGIERMVIPCVSMEAFYKQVGISGAPDKEKVKEFLNTTLESVVSSMKVMLEAKIISSEVKTIDSTSHMPQIQIGAIAGIVSSYFNGNLVIGFSNEDFKAAMARFLQMEVKEITTEIRDGVAELLNVIIGQTKIILNDRGFDIQQVIPNVISGESINILPANKQKAILINYVCDFGKFCIILTTSVSHPNH